MEKVLNSRPGCLSCKLAPAESIAFKTATATFTISFQISNFAVKVLLPTSMLKIRLIEAVLLIIHNVSFGRKMIKEIIYKSALLSGGLLNLSDFSLLVQMYPLISVM